MNKQVIAQKEAVVSAIAESVKNAQSVSVVEYRGLTVAQVESFFLSNNLFIHQLHLLD